MNPCLVKSATTWRGLRTGSFGMSFDGNQLGADELPLESGLAVLKQHFYHLAKIIVKFIERRALGMRSRKTWYVAHEQTRVSVPFDDRGKRPLHAFSLPH